MGNKYFISVFHLSKTLDTIDTKILTEKLEAYSVKGKSLLWLESHLAHRKQNIVQNKKRNSYSYITCAVPQGSIFGPLFIL